LSRVSGRSIPGEDLQTIGLIDQRLARFFQRVDPVGDAVRETQSPITSCPVSGRSAMIWSVCSSSPTSLCRTDHTHKIESQGFTSGSTISVMRAILAMKVPVMSDKVAKQFRAGPFRRQPGKASRCRD
jgi:hypothetical protein